MKTALGFGLLSILLAAGTAHAGAIVVGKDSPINSMDADTVKNVFMGRRPIVEGQTVTVLFQKDGSAARTEFETKIIGKTGTAFSTYMAKQIFTGKCAAPTVVDGDAAVRNKVSSSPTAIGYVSDDGIDSTVKVILKY